MQEIEKKAAELIERSVESTVEVYSQNAASQGVDLANGTKALVRAGASTCVVVEGLVERALDIPRVAFYGWDKIKEKFIPKVQKWLDGVPEENLIEPAEEIAGPILEAARFKTNDEEISDLFAALLASAMDNRSAESNHPAFTQIISELTADEAKIIRFFAGTKNDSYALLDMNARLKGQQGTITKIANFSDLGFVADCKKPNMIPVYVDNLCRLKLFNVPSGRHLIDKTKYNELKEHQLLKPHIEEIIKIGREPVYEEKILQITVFGRIFSDACKLF